MTFDASELQALRACCQDDAAFTQLLEILAQHQGQSPPAIALAPEGKVTAPLSETQLRRQNQVLVELARRKLDHPSNLNYVLREINQVAAETLEVEQVSIWLYKRDRSGVYCLDLYQRGIDCHLQEAELSATDYPAYFRALETERIMAVYDVHSDPRTAELAQSYLKALGITSMLDAPIWLGGQVVGVVCHEQVGAKRHWTPEEQNFAASIADFISLAMEASDRQRAEVQLQEREQQYRSIFEATSDGLIITDLTGQIIEANPVACRMHGYAHKEFIGCRLEDWIHSDYYALARNFLKNSQRGEQSQIQAFSLRHDGTDFPVEISGTALTYKGKAHVLLVVRDITDRKNAEAQLRLTADRDRLLAELSLRIRQSLDLDQILNTTVVEVRQFLQADRVFIGFIEDACQPQSWMQGKVVAEAVNPVWHSCLTELIQDPLYLKHLTLLFEQSKVRVVKDINHNALPLESRDWLSRYHIRASLEVPILLPRMSPPSPELDTGRQYRQAGKETCGSQFFGVLVVHQCSSSRQWHPFEIDLLEQLATRVAIAIQQGELYQQLAALNANLEQQVAERTALLQQKMQELQELNQLKDVFLHAVSHDLRTPVMGTLLVLNNLLNAATKAPDDSTADYPSPQTISVPRAVLERMIQSNDRQLTLINSLLEVHTSDVQGIVLHREPVQLRSWVQTILEDLDPLIVKNQAVLTYQIPADLPEVEVDAGQLRRVLENLIINALKHNPPGLYLFLECKVDNSTIRCTLEDNGMGICPEQIDHLFDLYFRGTNTRHLTGIGLGLYLCRQIITAHGGQIGVVSTVGQGATFWFTLPLSAISSTTRAAKEDTPHVTELKVQANSGGLWKSLIVESTSDRSPGEI